MFFSNYVQRYKKKLRNPPFFQEIQEITPLKGIFLGYFFLISEKSCYFAPRNLINDESIQ